MGIGRWMSIFTILSQIAVITNAGLCCFTMNVFSKLGVSNKWIMWIFIGFQWFFFFLQSVIEQVIPDQTYATEVQLQRMKFIVSKVLDKVQDEDPEVDDSDE